MNKKDKILSTPFGIPKTGVYVIRAADTDFYKIGITSKPVGERISQLQTGSPYHLIMIGFFPTHYAQSLESSLHREHASRNRRGEWFEMDEETIDAVVERLQWESLSELVSIFTEHLGMMSEVFGEYGGDNARALAIIIDAMSGFALTWDGEADYVRQLRDFMSDPGSLIDKYHRDMADEFLRRIDRGGEPPASE